MRYQQQDKGLFTFYKEQELFQMHIERLKQKKMEETQRELEATKRSGLMQQNSNGSKISSEKQKVTSQPSYNHEDREESKPKTVKIKQIGNSIIIMNRKNSSNKEERKKMKEKSYQQKSKETGYFIEKKNVEFSQLEKYKMEIPVLGKQKKKSFLRRREEFRGQSRYEDQEKYHTKLPTLVKVEQTDGQEEVRYLSHRSKANGSSLKYNGGELVKYIRNNISSVVDMYEEPVKRSVSYIEYSSGFIRESSPKKIDKLNEEQKRLLEVLRRYRQAQN